MMDSRTFVQKIKDVATKYKTVYVMGCFGAPMTESNKRRYIEHNAYNRGYSAKKAIMAASADTFGFDCVCLIKGILWGWNGNKNAIYGGATYLANGVPDIGADAMITYCGGVTSNFGKIEVGEAVWTDGHIGVYIGDGLAVECTPKWDNKVQVTAVGNIGTRKGYYTRTWKKHGKLPWVKYSSSKTVEEIAREVIAGQWGVGADRKRRLTEAGYDYNAVQNMVNEILSAINVLLGDVDGNGKIEPADARLALRAALGLESLSVAQKTAADFDKNGKIEPADARAILRKSLGLEG